MVLTRLLINNFRNIEQASISPTPDFNFLIGANGSGKTSVLEAIYTLGHGRAFRTLHTNRIIRHDQPAFVLHGRIADKEYIQRDIAVGLMKDRLGSTKIRINNDDRPGVAALARLLPIQLITPEGFRLLNGGPKYRRAYIDWGCFHQSPDFFQKWSNYRRLLKQRNAALRQTLRYEHILPWDQELAPLAEEISALRLEYSRAIIAGIMETCAQFLPECTLTFSFQRGWDKDRNYATLLEQQFQRDRELTYTAHGPHKADFRIRTEGVPVEEVLSRGQLKLLVCALRLAQGEHLSQRSNQKCLYLIDDFASELDECRRHLLGVRLKAAYAQVFVSAISADHIIDMVDEKGKMFHIKKGKITP